MSTLTDQIEALTDLQTHPGWQAYRAAVVAEITGDFEEHITRALDVHDPVVAIDRMRQVAAVRKAGLRWLQWPTERLATLKQQAESHQRAQAAVSRRPEGV